MKNYIVLAAVLAFAVATIIVAIAVRSSRSEPAAVATSKPPKMRPRPGHYVPPKVAGPPMKEDEVARAFDDVTMRTTFKNYRTAIATGNRRLRDALYPALSKTLPQAIALAEEELARARKPRDIEIAQETLASLRNRP